MSDVKVTVEHNGQQIDGQIMRIKSTRLGYEDHGILTAFLHCEGDGSGIGVGGYCLDQPRDKDARDYERTGTAYGLDHIIRIIETVGVESWEQLPGKDIIVLYKGNAGWGGSSAGIAGLHNGKVLLLAEHADAWRNTESERVS